MRSVIKPSRGGPSHPLCPVRGASGESFSAVLPAFPRVRPLFLRWAFDDPRFVAYTQLAEILDPFFGKLFFVLDIPHRKTRFLPHRRSRPPSPGPKL